MHRKALSQPTGTHALQLKKGELILASILEFCSSHQISFASFSAIGAVQSAEIGFYDMERKIYEFKEFSETLEIVSLLGNISSVDGKPFAHAHIGLSDAGFAMIGGHLKEAVVGGTCEIFLTAYTGEVIRQLDEETGLKLWQL